MRILVIGCGLIGELHARAIRRAGEHELILAERDERILREAAEHTGAAACYTDYREALGAERPDAAFICTPNALHAAQGIDALRAGCDVLVEKPVAASGEEARALCAEAALRGRRLVVGYTMRADPVVRRLRKLIRGESLGKQISARVILAKPETLDEAKTAYRSSYETGGGILYDYSHELDYCGMFFGEAAACACFKRLAVHSQDVTCDDTADMMVQYRNGVTVSYHYDYIQQHGHGRGRYLAVVFERGFAETDFVGELRIYQNGGDVEIYRPCHPDRWWSLDAQLEMFCGVCAGKPPVYPYADGESAARTVELVEALYRSAARGESIPIDSGTL